jgi:hypothetical protein
VRVDHEPETQAARGEVSEIVFHAIRSRIDEGSFSLACVRDEVRKAIVGAHLVHDQRSCHSRLLYDCWTGQSLRQTGDGRRYG